MKLSSSCILGLAGLPVAYGFVSPSKFNVVSISHQSFAQERGASASQHRHTQGALCMTASRVPFIAGNWKMNPLELDAAKDLSKKVSSHHGGVLSIILAVGLALKS